MDYRRQRGYSIRSNLSGGYTTESIGDDPSLLDRGGFWWRRVPPWVAVLTAVSPFLLIGVFGYIKSEGAAVTTSPSGTRDGITIRLIAPQEFAREEHPDIDFVVEPELAETYDIPAVLPFQYQWLDDPDGSPNPIPNRRVAQVTVPIDRGEMGPELEPCLAFVIRDEDHGLAHTECTIPRDHVIEIPLGAELFDQLN